MEDDRIHELLGCYRPVGPVAGLRSRVLTAAVRAPRTWPWAAAAAALFAVAIGLHAATNRAIARVAVPADMVSVETLTSAMGGDEEAARAATLLIQEQAFRDFLSGPGLDVQTIGEGLKSAN